MKKLLIFVDWYLPGYKAGGQISSCSNIAAALKDVMNIYIITRDRDLDDTQPYAGIISNAWQQLNNADIYYLSPDRENFKTISKLIKEVSPDTIYFNSMFSYKYTLLPLLVIKKMRFVNKVVIAPRGMLQSGALKYKTLKKRTLLNFLHYTAFLKHVVFHATDETEAADIRKNIQGQPLVEMVYDFPAASQEPYAVIDKEPGYIDCLFVSRVVQKKNLLFLLQAISKTESFVSLTIVGPVEDKKYWEQCQQQIAALPANCKVTYSGAVPHSMLPAIYREHHLFVLPTYGENFGHVIFDALLNGRPVLISDKTPWQHLAEKKIGFNISLTESDKFLNALEQFAAMNKAEFETWGRNAWLFAQAHLQRLNNLKNQYQSLFS